MPRHARHVTAALLLGLLTLPAAACGGAVGGVVETRELEQGQHTVETVRDQLGQVGTPATPDDGTGG